MSLTVEEKIFQAKLSEQAERYDDMAKTMNEVAKTKEKLSTEDRNLLSVAYKNVVGARRSSWRIIMSMASQSKEDLKTVVAKEYKKKVEDELNKICQDVLDLLQQVLIPRSKETMKQVCDDSESSEDETREAVENTVFYLKMKGDYYRYVSEVADDNESNVEQSKVAYEEALKISEESLKSTNPIRLGLALNFSVFFYEILKQEQLACDLAKKAFDCAIQDLDQLQEENYKDSTLIMQLLRDNLTLWTSEKSDDDDKPKEQSDQQEME